MNGQVPGSTYVTKCLLECNYLQGLECECDSSHLSFLHRAFTNERNQSLYKSDTAPVYETEETDFGVRLIAIRNSADNQHYVRMSAFVSPVYGCVPAGRPTNELDGYEIHTYVPADDTHCWRYDIGFRRTRPVQKDEVHRRQQIGPDYLRIRNARNDYLQDRQMQKRSTSPASRTFSTMMPAPRRAWVRSSIVARNISGSATKRSSPYGNFF
jgi:hypothetical protein